MDLAEGAWGWRGGAALGRGGWKGDDLAWEQVQICQKRIFGWFGLLALVRHSLKCLCTSEPLIIDNFT